MRVTDLEYTQVSGFLLERVEPNHVGKLFARPLTLVHFVHWKMEVLTKLGDIPIEQIKESKEKPFKIILKR